MKILVTGDLADRPFLDRLTAKHKPEGIMHFASNTLVSESVSDLQSILETAWACHHKPPHGYEDKR